MAEPNGPVEQAFFDRLMQRWEADLTAARAAGRRLSGAARRRADHRRTMIRKARCSRWSAASSARQCRSSPPSICMPTCRTPTSTLLDGFIGYRTNPHLDMRERGAEAAVLLRRLLGGHAHVPGAHPPADRAADGDAADRQGRAEPAVWRTDRPRPAAHGGAALCRAGAECLGDGRVRLRRYAVQRPDRGGDRDRPGRRRRAGAGDRGSRLGAARPVPPVPDQPGGRGAAGANDRDAADLRRCRRQSRRRRTRQHHGDPAGVPCGRGAAMRWSGVIHDPGPGRRGARIGRRRERSRRASTATAATNSPSRSPRRRSSPACSTSRSAAAAASTPTTRSTSARRPR